MGKVFGWEEVSQGFVPDLNGFGVVNEKLKLHLGNFEAITAATLCGSFLSGKHSIRSDMDCVLVYSEERQMETIRFLQELVQLAGTFYVPLEVVAIRRDIAMTPHHTLQATFLEHIALSTRKGGSIKGNVVACFASPNRTMKDETINYIVSKIRKLEKGWITLSMMGCDEYHRYLSKLLDAPMHIARKVCRTNGIEFGEDDSKQAVCKRYAEVSRHDEYGMLLELVELDGFYTRELKNHLVDPNFQSYGNMLKKLEREIPKVLEFAHSNLRLL